MVYRLVLDENVEHEIPHRLENYGHDVEYVDFVPALGKGTEDYSIAQYSLDSNRVIVTYDDDFVLEIDEDDYRAVVYFSDATLSVKQVADIVHTPSEQYPQAEIRGLEHVGEEWLWRLAASNRDCSRGRFLTRYVSTLRDCPYRCTVGVF